MTDINSNTSSTQCKGSAWSKGADSYVRFAEFTCGFAIDAIRAMLDKANLTLDSDVPLRVLDVAAGTGAASIALFRELAARADASSIPPERRRPLELLATDISSGMLDKFIGCDAVAQFQLAWPRASIATRVLDMQSLESVADQSHDLVICMFGIMFPSDPVAALREMRRVVAPSGHALITTWHYTSLVDMFAACAVDQGKVKEEKDFTMTPYKYGDQRFLSRLWREACGGDYRAVPTNKVEFSFAARAPYDFPPSALSAMATFVPDIQALGPWDLEKIDKVLVDVFARKNDEGEDVVPMAGTALNMLYTA
eukprot:PhM_4_TR10053/c2_g1_i4/m.42402